ncbi:MAG: hypothetical protein JWO41_835 [Candidatus Saccharibacteria bacterium]|nr:hypothetical protein [Candidatus Saccharibacteria bacterium]
MTTMQTETEVLHFTLSYIDRVWRATGDTMLRSALQRRDVAEIEARFKFQLMERPHHNDGKWLLKVRRLSDEFKDELSKFTNKK